MPIHALRCNRGDLEEQSCQRELASSEILRHKRGEMRSRGTEIHMLTRQSNEFALEGGGGSNFFELMRRPNEFALEGGMGGGERTGTT